MYALNLSEDKRILSACVVLPIGYVDEKGNPTSDEENGIPVYDIVDEKYHGMPIVETFPDDDVSNYLYIDGEYIYDPLPEPEPIEPEPTTDEVLNVLLGIGGEA